MLVVINLKISNLSSVLNALDYLSIKYKVSSDKADIKRASALILPGVGTFEAGMEALNKSDLLKSLREEVLVNKKPILGICLGMQMFFDTSEESPGVRGLSFIKGDVIRLRPSRDYTIPRIGWGESYVRADFLSLNVGDVADFYYIHSYFARVADKSVVAISTETNDVTGAVRKENVYGCQFHPEKSHKSGLRILTEFAKLSK